MTKPKFFDFLLLPIYAAIVICGELTEQMISVLLFFFKLLLKLRGLAFERLYLTYRFTKSFVTGEQDSKQRNTEASSKIE